MKQGNWKLWGIKSNIIKFKKFNILDSSEENFQGRGQGGMDTFRESSLDMIYIKKDFYYKKIK